MRAHQDYFEACLANAPIACHEIDLSGRIVRVNRAECELLGISAEEVLGRPVWEFVSPEEREASIRAVERKLTGEQPLVCFERDYIRPDGGRLMLEIREMHIRDAAGAIVGIRSFLADSTERKRAEQALRESEQRMKHFVEHATDIMYRADVHGRFTWVNPTAAVLMRCPAEKLLGRHYLELIRPDWRRAAHRFYRAQLARRIPNTYYEFPVVAADGTEIWFGQNVQLVWEGERICGVQAVTRDITDRKRAQGALQRAHDELERRVAERTAELAALNASLLREIEERKIAEEKRHRLEEQVQHAERLESLGVLAGGIAHDFNNLLTTILGYTGMAIADLQPDSPTVANLRMVRRAAARAAEVTAKMLAYSGKGHFVVRPVHLPALIAGLDGLLQSLIAGKTELSLALDPETPEIEADPEQLRQLLINLIVNASEAIGDRQGGAIELASGQVWLKSEDLPPKFAADLRPGPFAFLQVIDNGCGMDEAIMDRIFDPFFSTKFVGRGLGLAAVLGIVRGHHGAIEVESAPNQGTRFRILLPAAAGQLTSAAR